MKKNPLTPLITTVVVAVIVVVAAIVFGASKSAIYVGVYDTLDTVNNKKFVNVVKQGSDVNENIFKNYAVRDNSGTIIGYLAISEQSFRFGNDNKKFTTSHMNLDVTLNNKHIVVNAQAQNYLIRNDVNQNVHEPVILTYPITSQNDNTDYYYIQTIIDDSTTPRKIYLTYK